MALNLRTIIRYFITSGSSRVVWNVININFSVCIKLFKKVEYAISVIRNVVWRYHLVEWWFSCLLEEESQMEGWNQLFWIWCRNPEDSSVLTGLIIRLIQQYLGWENALWRVVWNVEKQNNNDKDHIACHTHPSVVVLSLPYRLLCLEGGHLYFPTALLLRSTNSGQSRNAIVLCFP